MSINEALEVVYRKDCCAKSPNPACSGCKEGSESKCHLHLAYMQISEYVERIEKIRSILAKNEKVGLGYDESIKIFICEEEDYKTIREWLDYDK